MNSPKGFDVKEVHDFSKDLPDAEASVQDVANKDMKISIIRVKCVNYDTCSSCDGKVEHSGGLMKCLSYKLSQRANPENKKWFARLFVQDVVTKRIR